jgi:hypothetical protein
VNFRFAVVTVSTLTAIGGRGAALGCRMIKVELVKASGAFSEDLGYGIAEGGITEFTIRQHLCLVSPPV